MVTEEADNEIAESEVDNGETTNTSEDTAESTEVDQEVIIEEEPIVCTYNTVTMQDVSVTSCGPYTVDYSGIRTSINADSSCFVEQTGGHFTGCDTNSFVTCESSTCSTSHDPLTIIYLPGEASTTSG